MPWTAEDSAGWSIMSSRLGYGSRHRRLAHDEPWFENWKVFAREIECQGQESTPHTP